MKDLKQSAISKQQSSICNSRGISLDIKPIIQKEYATPNSNTNEVLSLNNLSYTPKEKYHSFSPNKTNGDNSFIPPLKPSELKIIKTLVLDLDETLVHSSFTRFSIEADITIQVIIS